MPKSDSIPEINSKKLMRNPDGKVLGGVANGIASYFGIDVTIVRLLFVLIVFLIWNRYYGIYYNMVYYTRG
jgi:phage shock protein PspC (stress-responsive transcriptional regulator)